MRLPGFYKLSVEERRKILKEKGLLNEEDFKTLSSPLTLEKADSLVENVIGILSLPLGVATNFKINGKEYLVPMAIEEPSVIAAASRAAKECLPEGFSAEADKPIMIGQIFLEGPSFDCNKLREIGDEALSHLKKYGCGVVDVKERYLGGERRVFYFYVNVGNAQGANIVNSMLEEVGAFLSSQSRVIMQIVSNLAIMRKVRVRAVWHSNQKQVLDAYRCALADIYRCATHNKGIMNGIDAVALATGNDWRAVEAGAHAYASLNYYKPLTSYYINEEGGLVGELEVPMAVSTVGPAVRANPLARLSLKLLGVKDAGELAMVMGAVGLANNYAALSALSTEGIQKGHLRLHARRVAKEAGAQGEEIERVAQNLASEGVFSLERARQILEEIR